MILAPCKSVHTFFMRFAIDILFVSRNGRVVKVRSTVPAWRIAASLSAFAVIEMAAGSADSRDICAGDYLQFLDLAAS